MLSAEKSELDAGCWCARRYSRCSNSLKRKRKASSIPVRLLPFELRARRVAFFSEKTKLFYEKWMKERRSDVEHDHVLHGQHVQASAPRSLSEEFNRVLCKTWHGKPANDIGFDQWSFHRLRHNGFAASNSGC